MEFSYQKLGKSLARMRMHRKLRQVDLEEKSNYRLKQPAISDAERGETRLAVDTLVEYCNALGIRPDIILDPFLTTEPDEDRTDVIVDPYIIQLAELLRDCSPEMKAMILNITGIIKEDYMKLERENLQLKNFYGRYQDKDDEAKEEE